MGAQLPPIKIQQGDTLYVDSALGNDTTGKRQHFDKPFKKLSSGSSVATTGDEILIGPGSFTGVAQVGGTEAWTDLSIIASPRTVFTNGTDIAQTTMGIISDAVFAPDPGNNNGTWGVYTSRAINVSIKGGIYTNTQTPTDLLGGGQICSSIAMMNASSIFVLDLDQINDTAGGLTNQSQNEFGGALLVANGQMFARINRVTSINNSPVNLLTSGGTAILDIQNGQITGASDRAFGVVTALGGFLDGNNDAINLPSEYIVKISRADGNKVNGVYWNIGSGGSSFYLRAEHLLSKLAGYTTLNAHHTDESMSVADILHSHVKTPWEIDSSANACAAIQVGELADAKMKAITRVALASAGRHGLVLRSDNVTHTQIGYMEDLNGASDLILSEAGNNIVEGVFVGGTAAKGVVHQFNAGKTGLPVTTIRNALINTSANASGTGYCVDVSNSGLTFQGTNTLLAHAGTTALHATGNQTVTIQGLLTMNTTYSGTITFAGNGWVICNGAKVFGP